MLNEVQNKAIVDSPPRLSRIARWLAAPLSGTTRLLLCYCGILSPLICHGLSFGGVPEAPLWQTGELGDKLTFILSPQAGFPLYPLLLYAMVAMAMYNWNEPQYGKNFWVRLGIWGGLPLAAWYSFVFIAAFANVGTDYWLLLLFVAIPMLVLVGLWLILAFLKWLYGRVGIGKRVGHITTLLLYVFLVSAYAGVTEGPKFAMGYLVGIPVGCSLFFGPTLALATFGFVSARLFFIEPTSRRIGIGQMLGLTTWLAIFLASCRFSVLLSFRAYSQLPVEPVSRCYVVTAAAQGHRRFVGALPVGDGQSVPGVNRQLQILKAFELALQTLLPALHRRLRHCYDAVGPKLATIIQNPWLADLAYLSLKPFEWTAACLLKCLLKEDIRFVKQLFKNSPN